MGPYCLECTFPLAVDYAIQVRADRDESRHALQLVVMRAMEQIGEHFLPSNLGSQHGRDARTGLCWQEVLMAFVGDVIAALRTVKG